MQLKGTYKEIWQITFPVILGSVAHSVNQIVDTAFMGHISNADLGASNLAGLLFLNITFIGLGFARGSQIIIARKSGELNYKDIGKAFDHLLIIGAILSIFLFGLIHFGADKLVPLMVKNPAIISRTLDFLHVIKYGIPFVIGGYCFNAFFSGIGKTRIITLASFALTITNIVLGYIFVFGHLGFKPLGIKGAALGTLCADMVMLIVYIIAFLQQKYHHKFNALTFKNLELKLIGVISNLSSPIVIQNIIGIASWQVFFLCVEKLGEDELAVSSILKSFFVFIGIPVWSFSSSANTFVSNIIGQKREQDIMKALMKVVLCSVILSNLISLTVLIFHSFFFSLFTTDAHIIDMSLKPLYVLTGGILIFSFSMVLSQGIGGTGATIVTAVFEGINCIIYLAYCYWFIYVQRCSLSVAWCVEALYWTMLGIMTILYWRTGHWKKYIQLIK